MNHDEGEQSLSRILDGVWQSIQNSNKKGVSDWVGKVRAAANKARDLEKRNRELEAALEWIAAQAGNAIGYDRLLPVIAERARALLTPAKSEQK